MLERVVVGVWEGTWGRQRGCMWEGACGIEVGEGDTYVGGWGGREVTDRCGSMGMLIVWMV